MFYLLLLGDTQGLTCFWDESPCWRVPPSSTGFYNDSAYTGRIASPAVCLTSPLNPMSGVTLRVRVLSSSPRSWYAVWKIMLLELPLSTSILFTKQFATMREITRASWFRDSTSIDQNSIASIDTLIMGSDADAERRDATLTFFARGIRYRISIPELCRIYGFQEDAAASKIPPFLGLNGFWEIIGTGTWNSNSATQTDICHPTLRYFLRALANTLVCKMEPNKGDFQRVVVDALRAIWARVSCTSRRTIRAHSRAAAGPSRQCRDPSSWSDDETSEDTD
ncbi:hypothetical protein F2Q68_00005014 [Brassica cretica]|uniref:Arabidopsis retrotransposon Orf1 C-terminal domain-containing protein n=1 Tax=Brassica cretica TaxID=69181 RepID=A0A8S9JCD8_BRACR|nr:hypothetical protein F2Q68_00005014 [Brassica cretica]